MDPKRSADEGAERQRLQMAAKKFQMCACVDVRFFFFACLFLFLPTASGKSPCFSVSRFLFFFWFVTCFSCTIVYVCTYICIYIYIYISLSVDDEQRCRCSE